MGCANIRISKKAVYFRVENFNDIEKKVIPFLVEFPVHGVKAQDLQDFLHIVELMQNKAHLTQEGLELIRTIKPGMNKGRSV